MSQVISHARKLRLQHQVKLGRRVSIQEVAGAIGVDRKRLTDIELGRFERIDRETLTKLCQFYEVGVGDILEYVNNGGQQKEGNKKCLDIASGFQSATISRHFYARTEPPEEGPLQLSPKLHAQEVPNRAQC
jgi:DNA-binding Xre family transcriptional regulator